MLALFVVFAVYSCTFVGFNERLEGSAKAGFFVTFAVVSVLVCAANWVLG